jgi:hypothetical protein
VVIPNPPSPTTAGLPKFVSVIVPSPFYPQKLFTGAIRTPGEEEAIGTRRYGVQDDCSFSFGFHGSTDTAEHTMKSASAGLGFCSNQVALYRLDCEIAPQLFARAA